jgi:hypothetical protein
MAISPYLIEKVPKRQHWEVEKLAAGIQKGDIATLSKAITLLESQLVDDLIFQKQLLQLIKPPKKITKRFAISGIPGVGKSTFIEKFGLEILNLEPISKIAVLTIDPNGIVQVDVSSSISGSGIATLQTKTGQLPSNVYPIAPRGILVTVGLGGDMSLPMNQIVAMKLTFGVLSVFMPNLPQQSNF